MGKGGYEVNKVQVNYSMHWRVHVVVHVVQVHSTDLQLRYTVRILKSKHRDMNMDVL